MMPRQQFAQFKLNLPPAVRDRLKADAARNNRSINAEILHRLSGDTASPLDGGNLRDQIAMAALTGLIASTANPNSIGPQTYDSDEWARISYRLADAMLEARGR